MADSVFHKDFKSMPWWWEWWHPTNELSQDPPRKTDVLVVGAGYGGLSTALELARSGGDVTVPAEQMQQTMSALLHDAADSLSQVETVIEREGIECHWRILGRFVGA